jgi:hypothetical protein
VEIMRGPSSSSICPPPRILRPNYPGLRTRFFGAAVRMIVIAIGLMVALAFSTLIKAFTDSIITPILNRLQLVGVEDGIRLTVRVHRHRAPTQLSDRSAPASEGSADAHIRR